MPELSPPVLANFASLLGGIAAVVGVPLLAWQIWNADRSRRLDMLESDDVWHVDRVPQKPTTDAATQSLRREIRMLVSLTWLLGQRTRLAGRPQKGDLLRIIENEVALQLGMRDGLLRGFLATSGDGLDVIARTNGDSLFEEIRKASHFAPYDKLLTEQTP